MEAPAPSPSALPVALSDLASHVSSAVLVAGVVVDTPSATTVRLEDHERATVLVQRPAGALVVLQPGMKVLVRGTVNQDLSVSEDAAHPTTNLGEKYDLKLHHDGAKVMSQPALAALFT